MLRSKTSVASLTMLLLVESEPVVPPLPIRKVPAEMLVIPV